MLYEFICGGVPFGDDVNDPLMIYDKIIEYNLKFPSFF
jgi:cGMP-dependent protein kinase